jgi:hypothetical protein
MLTSDNTEILAMQHALLLILKNRWCISFSKLAILFVLPIIFFNVSVPIYSSLPYFRSSFQILVNLFLFSIYITYLSWTFSNQQSNNLLGCFVLSSFLIYDTTGSTSGAQKQLSLTLFGYVILLALIQYKWTKVQCANYTVTIY